MTRRRHTRHEHADDHYGAHRPSIERQLEGTPMFDGTAALQPQPKPPAGVIPETDAVRSERKRARVARLHETTSRVWIDRGKPIALEVARVQGSVTAERYRAEAKLHRGVLPPETEQRSLSFIVQMFAELCREGLLKKKLRADDSVVTEYSVEHRNSQVVYILTERAAR